LNVSQSRLEPTAAIEYVITERDQIGMRRRRRSNAQHMPDAVALGARTRPRREEQDGRRRRSTDAAKAVTQNISVNISQRFRKLTID
jgi:hypothetical protein